MQKLTSMQGASGVDDKVMLELFIPTHQVIIRPMLLPFFFNMNLRRSLSMGIMYVHVVDDEYFISLAIFPTFGGLGKEATTFYICIKLADLL